MQSIYWESKAVVNDARTKQISYPFNYWIYTPTVWSFSMVEWFWHFCNCNCICVYNSLKMAT